MATKKKSALQLAKDHLKRAQVAAADPTDWLELATFGFYALEAAVVAAGEHVGKPVKKTHPGKVEVAAWLAKKHALPDVSDLLYTLNMARKSEAYGDVDFPEGLDADEVSAGIDEFVDAVSDFIKK